MKTKIVEIRPYGPSESSAECWHETGCGFRFVEDMPHRGDPKVLHMVAAAPGWQVRLTFRDTVNGPLTEPARDYPVAFFAVVEYFSRDAGCRWERHTTTVPVIVSDGGWIDEIPGRLVPVIQAGEGWTGANGELSLCEVVPPAAQIKD